MANALNRRGFLARLGLTAGASAAAITGTAIAVSAAPIAEDPAFLVLGDQIVTAAGIVREAKARLDEAVALFHATRPEVPAELRDRNLWIDYARKCGRRIRPADVRDGYGQLVWTERRSTVMYASAEELAKERRYHDGRTAAAKKYKLLHAIAGRYEADDAEAMAAARVVELREDHEDKQWELQKLCDKLFALEARSMVGIEVMAGAMGLVPLMDMHAKCYPIRWGPRIADNLLKVLAREAST